MSGASARTSCALEQDPATGVYRPKRVARGAKTTASLTAVAWPAANCISVCRDLPAR